MNIPEPILRQIPVDNTGLGWFKKTCNYVCKPNLFEVMFDWKIVLPDGTEAMVPQGFRFDGCSSPWFMRPLISNFGPLLKTALLHDFGYRNNYLLNWAGGKIFEGAGQKFFDNLFRSVGKVTTGLSWLTGIAWVALRGFGFIAFNKHRKGD